MGVKRKRDEGEGAETGGAAWRQLERETPQSKREEKLEERKGCVNTRWLS